MRSLRFRRIGRVFAVLLLVWTSAHLCAYGLCEHSREPLVPGMPSGPWQDAAVSGRPEGPAPEAPPLAPPDDCFCCSHFVDVKLPFHIVLVYAFAWTVPSDIITSPSLGPSRLYHPPLG